MLDQRAFSCKPLILQCTPPALSNHLAQCKNSQSYSSPDYAIWIKEDLFEITAILIGRVCFLLSLVTEP